MIKLLLENFKKYLLLELRLEEILPKLDSNKFVNASNYHKINPEKAKKLILDTVPEDVEDSEKANYLNWRIKQFMVNGTIKGPSPKSVEIFYTIKANSLDRLLTKNDINSFESVEEFSEMMKSSSRRYLEYQKKKKESTVVEKDINKIYENEDWEVYIPESKAASCRLGTGTNWCTAARGKRNYYNDYHTKEDPLIIFISKKDPEEKYQFHYSSGQFKNRKDQQIEHSLLFYKLNNIVKKLTEALPSATISLANKYKLEELPDGGYIIKDGTKTSYYKDGLLHRDNDQPAVIDSRMSTYSEAWYQHGKLHRDGDKPALLDTKGRKFWYQHGNLHRDNDQPAVIDSRRTTYSEAWYQHGKLHRDGDKPALLYGDGSEYWYQHGKLHRDNDQPGYIDSLGTKKWYKDGRLHRENGLPAIIEGNGTKHWYREGHYITKEKPAHKLKSLTKR